jgi:hypothetical protein
MQNRDSNELPVMYNGAKKTEERVSFHILSISQDQPERREMTGLLRGNSVLHGRFGYSVNIKENIKDLRPCLFCLSQMQSLSGDVLSEDTDCSHCLNWMSEGRHITFAPDNDYPKELLPPNGKLEMTRLSYGRLLESVQTTHDKILGGHWDVKTSQAFLRSWCIPEKHQNEIIECAENCRLMNRATVDMNVDVMEALQVEASMEPERYEPWKPPAVWNSQLQLFQSHETPMHLLCLGIGKSNTLEFQNWAVL